MTTAADDSADEIAFEAFLAGRPVPAEADGGSPVTAFAGAVRATATLPGRPNAALAELLATGLLTDQSSPSPRTAPSAGPLPSRSARSRTRRRFTVIVPALIAKFLSAGAIAQAATGAGVVVVVVTGAGAANVLPDGAQETFSDLTGIHQTIDEAGDELADPVVKPVEGQPLDPADPALQAPVEGEADVTAFDVEAWGRGYDPDVYASFGAWVSLGAHNKADLAEFLAAHEYRNFGAMVSAEAHKKGVDDDELADELADEGLALEDLKDGEDGTDGERTETSDDSEAGASNAGDDSTSHGKSADKGNAGAKGQGHGDGQGHGGKN